MIVIVSGYFSPLHCGHLDYLEEAAAAGDRLVVIVNNNEQQILKKGKLILDQEDRLLQLDQFDRLRSPARQGQKG